jgi:hypothetical protein
MNKTFRNSAIALTIIGGAALFAMPASANPVTHDTSLKEVSKSVGLTDVGWRRHYRHWGPPAYYAPPPAYGYYGPRFYGPGPGFSVYVD